MFKKKTRFSFIRLVGLDHNTKFIAKFLKSEIKIYVEKKT